MSSRWRLITTWHQCPLSFICIEDSLEEMEFSSHTYWIILDTLMVIWVTCQPVGDFLKGIHKYNWIYTHTQVNPTWTCLNWFEDCLYDTWHSGRGHGSLVLVLLNEKIHLAWFEHHFNHLEEHEIMLMVPYVDTWILLSHIKGSLKAITSSSSINSRVHKAVVVVIIWKTPPKLWIFNCSMYKK